MNQILNISLVIIMALGLAACGGDAKPGKDLASKRKTLEKLKSQQVAINEQIEVLEKEIDALDTTKRTATPVPVDVSVIKPGSLEHFIEIQGQVESNRNVLVSPKMSGVITQVYVTEGQFVQAGASLAKIDDAVLKASRAELETQISLAKTIFEKQKRLWDQEIGSEIQYLQAKNNYESLQKRLASIDEQLDMARIKAPISGVVDEVMPKAGEMASPGMPVARIVSPAELKLVANVSESYAPFIKRNDAVVVNFPAIDKKLNARITAVGQTIDPTSRSFEVEARLPADKEIKINMYGKMAINDRNLENVILAPVDVLQKGARGNYVYIAREQNGAWVATRREVSTGLSYREKAEITAGLEAGDRLITRGYKDLSEGQAIRFDQPVAKQ